MKSARDPGRPCQEVGRSPASQQRGSLVAVNGLWAGLGNRLRFTLSAQAVAEREARSFSYYWPTARGVFEPHMTDIWDYRAHHANPACAVPNLTQRPSRFARERSLTDLRHVTQWRIMGASVLRGDGSEAPWETHLPRLELTSAMAIRLAQERERLPKRYVGIQIRAHGRSHAQSLSDSPVAWFVDRMRAVRGDAPETHFFLSCDDPAAQDWVQTSVPNVHSLADKGAYNSVAGLRDAVIDLYLLAQSSHLIGPHMSSFVQIAWLLGGQHQPFETSAATMAPGSYRETNQQPSKVYQRPEIAVLAQRLRVQRQRV